MGDLTKNFSRHEFACKCGCGFDTVDYELVTVLQDVADHFKEQVIITSACRCKSYNELVGGSKASKHKLGIAADIVVLNTEPYHVYDYLNVKYFDRYGIGKYEEFTHIDVRGNKARW